MKVTYNIKSIPTFTSSVKSKVGDIMLVTEGDYKGHIILRVKDKFISLNYPLVELSLLFKYKVYYFKPQDHILLTPDMKFEKFTDGTTGCF